MTTVYRSERISSSSTSPRFCLVSQCHEKQSCVILLCGVRSGMSCETPGCGRWQSASFGSTLRTLFDIFQLRASYRIVDHRERQIAPHSLCFDLSAQRLYCGFEDAIEVFDLARPGEGTRIPTTPSKKSKDGLKGIVSALAFSASFTADESFFAAGTFTPTEDNIALFSDAQREPLMYVGGGPSAGVTQVDHLPKKNQTLVLKFVQLKFNPMKPHILYAGYRGHASGLVYSWDTRSNVDQPLEIFQTLNQQQPRTNQKMRFDLDVAGRLLSIGDKVREDLYLSTGVN